MSMKKMITLMLAGVLAAQPAAAYGATITAGGGNSFVMSGPGAANWQQEGENWYYCYADGTRAQNKWEQIKGLWYYFGEDCVMDTGLVQVEGKWYFLQEDGAMVTNQTMEINGLTYEFGEDGSANITSPYKQPTYIPPYEEMTDIMKTDAAMADQILARITNPSMTDREKAVAIYNWVRGNLSYGVSGTVGDWAQAAYEGLRRRRGNCYTYYATSLILLNRAGIPSIEVIRSRDNDHWWNLVYIDGNWYHFDTTPRRIGGNFCLLTTAELLNYSRRAGNSHVFDQSLYPPTP